MSYGSGTSTFNDLHYSFDIQDEDLSVDLSINRLSARIRDSQFILKNLNDYQSYNDFFNFLIALVFTSANDIELRLSTIDNPDEYINFTIRKFILSLDNINLNSNVILNANFNNINGDLEFSFQDISFNISDYLLANSYSSAEDRAVLSILNNIDVSKIDSKLSMLKNVLSYNGKMNTSFGNCQLDLKYIFPILEDQPLYIEKFELNISNLDSSIKPFVEILISNSEIPFTKTPNGFSLNMKGTFLEPYIY